MPSASARATSAPGSVDGGTGHPPVTTWKSHLVPSLYFFATLRSWSHVHIISPAQIGLLTSLSTSQTWNREALSFCPSAISLSLTPSVSVHVVACARTSFLRLGTVRCMYTPHCVPLLRRWCEQCCRERGCTNVPWRPRVQPSGVPRSGLLGPTQQRLRAWARGVHGCQCVLI